MNPLAPVIAVVVSVLLVWLARATDSSVLFQLLLAVSSTFLVLLVLVQKGRGGGLAGALGGPGGSSAFGAKAGDIFTRITIVAAVVWVVFAIGAALWAKNQQNAFGTGGGQLSKPSASAPAGSTEGTTTPPTDSDSPIPSNPEAPAEDPALPIEGEPSETATPAQE
jgi:preprotein translocase subunit SecG